MIFLTLIFTCGDGCGPYETQQQCVDAGKVWISTAANFTFAIKGYQCAASPSLEALARMGRFFGPRNGLKSRDQG